MEVEWRRLVLTSASFCPNGNNVLRRSYNVVSAGDKAVSEDIRTMTHSPNGELVQEMRHTPRPPEFLTTLTANPRARYRVKRHTYQTLMLTLTLTSNANP